MQKFKATSLFSAMIASSIILTACGGGGSSSDTTPKPTPTVPSIPTISTNPIQTAVLSGTVISKASNTPIAGATVKVDNLSATTDKEGKYTLSNISTGTKNITVSANGFISQSIERNLVAKNTLDVALVPAIAINPSIPSNPTTPPINTSGNFENNYFSFDLDDNNHIVYIQNFHNVHYPTYTKTYFNDIYGNAFAAAGEDVKDLYLANGVTYINQGEPDNIDSTEKSHTYYNYRLTGDKTITHKYIDKISGKSLVNTAKFYPINLQGNPTKHTFLNALPLLQDITFNFPEGSVCYGSEITDFTNYFEFDLTNPTDYRTLEEWKEQYATSRDDNKPTYRTYQVGTNNELTVTTVTIGNATNIREAIVKYQNLYYTGSYEMKPNAEFQAITKNECGSYNDIAKNYMISEIKKYYK